MVNKAWKTAKAPSRFILQIINLVQVSCNVSEGIFYEHSADSRTRIPNLQLVSVFLRSLINSFPSLTAAFPLQGARIQTPRVIAMQVILNCY